MEIFVIKFCKNTGLRGMLRLFENTDNVFIVHPVMISYNSDFHAIHMHNIYKLPIIVGDK